MLAEIVGMKSLQTIPFRKEFFIGRESTPKFLFARTENGAFKWINHLMGTSHECCLQSKGCKLPIHLMCFSYTG